MKIREKKVLTIVVPVYNTEKYLTRCLDSILSKEFQNKIEVILVNDGSKDNSIEILKKYKNLFPSCVIIIDKENGGHGSTINAALQIASGRYFRVIDSDDWVNSIDFEKFLNSLDKLNVDLIVTNYRKEHVYNGKSELLQYSGLKDGKTYDFAKLELKKLKGEYFVMATSTYNTNLLRKSGLKLFEKTFYVDMQYNIVAIRNVRKFVYQDLDIYRYFIGRKEQSISMESFVKNKSHHDRVMRFIIDDFVENKDSYNLNKRIYIKMIIIYMLYTHYSIYCFYDRNKKEAIKEIKDFDNYLFSRDQDLYIEMNEYEIIRICRKYKFVPVLLNKTLLQYLLLYNKNL